MTYPKAFPGATWVGSKRDGKVWIGTTAPKLVIHTLEFNAWCDPDRWDSPSHLVCNPNTREIHQYLPMDVAAYAVRDNAQENDQWTWQVELWGRAAGVPFYDDNWYQGVAALCDTFVREYDLPPVFADFTLVRYGAYAPQRMSDEDVTAHNGFLGHCHMGYGTDEHWDPGQLDVAKVLSYMETVEDEMSYQDFRAAEFDLWSGNNIMEAYDDGMFEDPNRDGFYQYWVVNRDERTDAEKARFMTDFYSHLR